MDMFKINNQIWGIKYVPWYSDKLMRSDGSRTVGMTDGLSNTVYLADNLDDDFLEDVLCHELCHCVCFSYNIIMPIEEEERLCNFMRDHGREVIYLLDSILVKLNIAV